MIKALGAELDGVLETVQDVERSTEVKVGQVMTFIGQRTIEYLRSLTNLTAPPIRRGDPPRRRHPTYWADRSGQLAASYRFEVDTFDGGAGLTLMNDAEYAVHLEARDGYYVLSGVADRGGPVEDALRRAIAAIAPEWELVTYE